MTITLLTFTPINYKRHAGAEAVFDFSGTILIGQLPKRTEQFVQDWISLHQIELEENWRRAQSGEPLIDIAPLE